jgi:hypothetical protein
MRFSNPLKICLLILCLSQISSATGTPQFRGATFFMKKIIVDSPKHGIKEILVDDEDFDFLSQKNWQIVKVPTTFYATRQQRFGNGIRKLFYMHRVILNLKHGDETEVDHRDHNGLNNQRSNLRKASVRQNGANRTSKRNSNSKFLGVTFIARHNRYKVSIVKDKKSYYLGYFKTEEEAALAYNKKAIELHGEFANLNQI